MPGNAASLSSPALTCTKRCSLTGAMPPLRCSSSSSHLSRERAGRRTCCLLAGTGAQACRMAGTLCMQRASRSYIRAAWLPALSRLTTQLTVQARKTAHPHERQNEHVNISRRTHMSVTSSSSSRSHQTEGSEGSRYLSWGAWGEEGPGRGDCGGRCCLGGGMAVTCGAGGPGGKAGGGKQTWAVRVMQCHTALHPEPAASTQDLLPSGR